MISNASSPKALFGFQFVTLSRRWRKVIHAELAATGLTDATWTPLVYLDAGGDGITQKALAELVGLDTSTLVRLLDILSERKLIERQVDPNDRRARLIVLTKAGRVEVARIKAQLIAVEAELLSGLDETEVAVMLRAFSKISNKVEAALVETALGEASPAEAAE
ncbi:MarR family winged helix-turn-helix transcriptional regulator [uncultured Roseibium sp.]|uniref:MarR family winged helix-turn-helix transcriptional regulator n=1 Tax=uncultured Roseibium sp. TaxID=1936171 RepID=UPI0032162A8C